jgi:hypothetical protein
MREPARLTETPRSSGVLRGVLLLATTLLVTAGAPVAAQPLLASPLLELSPPPTAPWPSLTYTYVSPAVTDLGAAGIAAAWASPFRTTDPEDYDRVAERVEGAVLRRDGRVARFLVSTDTPVPGKVAPPVLATLAGDRFVVAWSDGDDLGGAVSYRRFAKDGTAVDAAAVVGGRAADGQRDQSPAVAASGEGFVLAWMRTVRPLYGGPSVWAPVMQRFDGAGAPLAVEVEIAPRVAGENTARPAVVPETGGGFLVLWPEPARPSATTRTLRAQRFAVDGTPVDAAFHVLDTGFFDVTAAPVPAGGFVVAHLVPDRGVHALRVQRFTASGRAGAVVDVARGTALGQPSLTSDAAGNLAIAWVEGKRTALALLDHDLVRQGAVTYDTPATPSRGWPARAAVALATDRRLVTVWVGPRATGSAASILARRWRARCEDDLCVLRDGRFLCDTGNDGGTAELKMRFGQLGDVPFVGDASGRGEADPCVFRAPRFRCDLGRDGVGIELPLDVPSGAQPLLGDLDGDGLVDPCYRQGNRWTCRVWTIAPVPLVTWTFGVAGERALLGDVDGDGADDACVLRAGRVVCRIDHGGAVSQRTLDARGLVAALPNGTPLLGDLDGDGRAEACRYRDGRLLCAVFGPRGGAPQRTLELRFGGPGDLPTLGDLDGF